MFTPYRSLTEMLVAAGEIRGRKKLQKMVFIAQSLGYSFPEPFDLHVWGPYSEVLAVKLKEMTDWGFAREEVLPGPAGNQHYIYQPGPNAARVLAESACSAAGSGGQLMALVSHLNAQDATFLEGVATVLYLRAKGQADVNIGPMLTKLKPDKFPDDHKIHPVVTFATDLVAYKAG